MNIATSGSLVAINRKRWCCNAAPHYQEGWLPVWHRRGVGYFLAFRIGVSHPWISSGLASVMEGLKLKVVGL